MTTFDCSDPVARRAGLEAAAAAAQDGRLVVLPTDTVYGIGADAFNAAAVRDLLAAKGRGPDMPVPVLVGVLVGDRRARRGRSVRSPASWSRRSGRAGCRWSCEHAPSLRWDLGDTRGTVMLRMPLHPVALDLLRTVGPMAVSSANRSGQPPATTAADASANSARTSRSTWTAGRRRSASPPPCST